MSKLFHCIFFIMINIFIHANTFFKICGFARFDPFHHFLKCMLGISRWFHFVFFFFIMMKTSIFTNTFFKICGFARFGHFDFWTGCWTFQNGFIFSLLSIYPFTRILFSKFADLHNSILLITFWNICWAFQNGFVLICTIWSFSSLSEMYVWHLKMVSCCVFFFNYDENIHFHEYFFQNLRICKIW